MLDCGFRPLDTFDIRKVASVQDFLDEVGSMPKLVFAEDGQALIHEAWVQTDYNQPEWCASLEAPLIVLQTDETYMRGHHYDTQDERGIALLMAAPCSSERAYIQALGRVGRYGKPCLRYIVDGVDRFDDSGNAAAIGAVL